MIFPILSGFVTWSKAPITWLLIALNFVVLTFTSAVPTDDLDDIMHQRYFLRTQGRLYARHIASTPSSYPTLLTDLSRQVLESSADPRELGELAFRDSEFLDAADSVEDSDDRVALKLWRKNVAEMNEIEERHPSFTLGLSVRDLGFAKWVSYIFVHSGGLHFAGNMLIFAIFGAALEAQIGGLALMVVFLLSGLVAAGFFALMTGFANSPLVGASGAISGIVALYGVLNWRRPARYFYWLFLPFRGYMGFVYLPAWIGLLLWTINDLAGFLSTVPELGGVAHAAHLGGEIAGALVALILFGLRRFWPVALPHSVPPGVPQGVLLPFLPPRRS